MGRRGRQCGGEIGVHKEKTEEEEEMEERGGDQVERMRGRRGIEAAGGGKQGLYGASRRWGVEEWQCLG